MPKVSYVRLSKVAIHLSCRFKTPSWSRASDQCLRFINPKRLSECVLQTTLPKIQGGCLTSNTVFTTIYFIRYLSPCQKIPQGAEEARKLAGNHGQTKAVQQRNLPNTDTSISFTRPFFHLIWACLRLGRLHTLMGWAIFPAPSIYALILGFSTHAAHLA